MRSFLLICVLCGALFIMNMNWGDGIVFWKQQTNTVTQNYTETEIAQARSIPVVSTKAVLPALFAEDRPTLLLIYASWCPHCRKQFPILSQLHAEFGHNINFAALSLDSDARQLNRFLANIPTPLFFDPVILKPTERRSFISLMQNSGSRFDGAIPHVILFNKDRAIAFERVGLTQAHTLKNTFNVLP